MSKISNLKSDAISSNLLNKVSHDVDALVSHDAFNLLIEGLTERLTDHGYDHDSLKKEIKNVFEDAYLNELIKLEEKQSENIYAVHGIEATDEFLSNDHKKRFSV